MPPLWHYFLPLRKAKAVESIPAPKGRESRTPQTFSPANGPLPGGPRRGPRCRSRTPLAGTLRG